jgi:hypothetical protein
LLPRHPALLPTHKHTVYLQIPIETILPVKLQNQATLVVEVSALPVNEILGKLIPGASRSFLYFLSKIK